jgi:acyl dehydratase
MKTLATDAVGKLLGPVCRTVTPRMLMAYAAVLGAVEDVYLDDVSGIQAFPPFLVVPEWDIMNGRAYREALGADEATMWACIHVQQDSRFYKPIKPGMRLATAGKVCDLRATRIGTLASTELTTTDQASGEVLARSWFSGIFLGHAPSDGGRTTVSAPVLVKRSADGFDEPPRFLLDVSRALPHLYTEAASIWNPIHTERQAARSSGLDDTLLHGTCTWASAGLALVREHAAGDPARLARLAGRMAGQALVGRRLDIQSRWLGTSDTGFQVAFQVLDGATVVLADGIAEFSAG